MLPGISPKIVKFIATQYDFSGGQLDNIAKKIDMFQIVYGKAPGMKEVKSFCDKECIENAKTSVNTVKGFIEY